MDPNFHIFIHNLRCVETVLAIAARDVTAPLAFVSTPRFHLLVRSALFLPASAEVYELEEIASAKGV